MTQGMRENEDGRLGIYGNRQPLSVGLGLCGSVIITDAG